ncbi:MAG: HAD-IA family hydrolase [Chloroflexi bacterium]|nr:HAD-IA family hydrolase [Chloroflexota bacterium]
MNKKYLIWDFDGTLGYREGRSWAMVLIEVLDRQMPGHSYSADQLAPHLRTGFPWHMPERPHTYIISADQWWAEMTPVFVAAFDALGVGVADPVLARNLARQIRPTYCNPDRWRLFDDTLPVLDELAARGWTHILLSNHVPELAIFMDAVDLSARIAAVFNSAIMGYEKPHPAAFRGVLEIVGDSRPVWMIGDNITADVFGAAAVGIPGVLVRRPDERAERFCADLWQVAALVEDAHGPGDSSRD